MSKRKNKQKTSTPTAEPVAAGVQYPPPTRGFGSIFWVFSLAFLVQSVLCGYLLMRRGPSEASQVESSELERILALPDTELENVSIARINFLVAKELLPDLDVSKLEADFDLLVQGLKSANARYGADDRDPDKLIRVLNTYLYMDKKFRYAKLGNSTDPALLGIDPTNLFLHGTLEKMQGTCISMPVLYIALGEALGYPIKGVNVGDHFFCRWDGKGYVSNIEPTGGGGWSPDEDYIRDMKVTKEQLASGAYMRSLSKREVIGNFFFARASHYAATGRPNHALEDFKRVVACNPRDVDGYPNLARLAAQRARTFGKAVSLPIDAPQAFFPQPGGSPFSSLVLPEYASPRPEDYLPKIPGVPAFGQQQKPISPHPYMPPGTIPSPHVVPDPLKDSPGLRRTSP